jgi:hypothetical protein
MQASVAIKQYLTEISERYLHLCHFIEFLLVHDKTIAKEMRHSSPTGL